ncbi:MAG: hypothetical protein VCD33_10125 [Alphaproteobacteria bacterium]
MTHISFFSFLLVEQVEQPGEPAGAALDDHELHVGIALQGARGDQQGHRAHAFDHAHGHVVEGAADAGLLAPIGGVAVF